jgi:hypothetical protein
MKKTQIPSGAARYADVTLYRSFVKLLPSTGGNIGFLAETSLGYKFDLINIHQLDEFRFTWDDAEHEFLDAEIDNKRQSLLVAYTKFSNWIGHNTGPANRRPYLQEIFPTIDEDEKGFTKKVQEAHELAQKVVAAHQDLVRTARRRLEIV